MNFTPKTEEEIAAANMLPAGEYDYEVVEAHERVSKTGNDMIELKLRVFAAESERTITDYLLEAMPGKLKHFCDSHGMSKHYENGTLQASDCEMLSGKCKVGIEKDKTGKYPDKNRIADYVVSLVSMPRSASAPTRSAMPPTPGDPTDDQIPF
jgi:hypothetical protein